MKKTLENSLLLLVLLLICLFNGVVWTWLNQPKSGALWSGKINGVSFSPYQKDQNPLNGDTLSKDDLRRDLALLSSVTRSVRTYSTLSGLENIPSLAARHKLSVTAGAWISKDPAANDAEIKQLIELTRKNRSIRRVIVGNETLLRQDSSVDQLIAYIKEVKKKVRVPVSTAETWDIWLREPQLAKHVDFITIHILPYWESIPADQAMNHVRAMYAKIKEAFPGKRILIGEVGWPSDGAWQRGAEPSRVNQGQFIREFLNFAKTERLDYYIMEAFDQPWKHALEGYTGASWGLFDADRQPKFSMTEGIYEMPDWPVLCLLSTFLGAILAGTFILRRRDLKTTGIFFYALLIQGAVSMLVWTAAQTFLSDRQTPTEISWFVLVGCQILLLMVMLIDGLELTEVLWARYQRRQFQPHTGPLPSNPPKISIHVPCYNEPPEMVKETLDALARLDYPRFEVLVIDNNTKDESVWKPLEEYCLKLGAPFRFFHLPQWPGYKAGALNFGLDQTAEDASIIAVIDSDYKVSPDWLKSVVPFFDRPHVGFVQSPQDYRDWSNDTFKAMCNWEYQGFFHIGMIQRNERNAIIQHGTMTLVRKEALKKLNGWAEWCICEDAELGLRLFKEGYEAVYMPDSFGQGLVPDTLSAYKSQRWRWAYGAVQILKRHWRDMLPGAKSLTTGQKYHFITGWLPWFADAAHFAFAVGALLWSTGLLLSALTHLAATNPWVDLSSLIHVMRSMSHFFEFPPAAFMLPTATVFGFKMMGSLWLYNARVKCGFKDKIGALVAGMALTHTIGRAVWQGIFTSGRPFIRTPKCENQPAFAQAFLMAKEETLLMLALWASSGLILMWYSPANQDALLWSIMLVVQSLPYLAALAMSIINSSQKR